MDDHMLFGCSGFVVTSIGCYLLGAWPFFMWLDIHNLKSLAVTLALGIPISFVIGAIASWRFGLAGAAGFVGGVLALAIFLYLRFEQVFLEAEARRITFPDYPQWILWFLPGMVVALSITLSAIILSFAKDQPESKK